MQRKLVLIIAKNIDVNPKIISFAYLSFIWYVLPAYTPSFWDGIRDSLLVPSKRYSAHVKLTRCVSYMGHNDCSFEYLLQCDG